MRSDDRPAGELELSDALPEPRFTERHRRIVDLPNEVVWRACRRVTPREVRTLSPLMAARGIPSRLRHRPSVGFGSSGPLIDAFLDAGFVALRCDEQPRSGRALTLLGAAGKFWSPIHNRPRAFDDAATFLDFAAPGYAKTVVSLEVTDLGREGTLLQTQTWVRGTDSHADRRFAPYWALIHPFSGLIRRSWLAAIERRATDG